MSILCDIMNLRLKIVFHDTYKKIFLEMKYIVNYSRLKKENEQINAKSLFKYVGYKSGYIEEALFFKNLLTKTLYVIHM